MLKRMILSMLAAFVCITPVHAEQVDDKIVMVSTRLKSDPEGRWLNKIFTEAFNRMGIDFEYKSCPAKRCSHMSDHGLVDGELWRAHHYKDEHPNMVRVEESLNIFHFAAFAIDTDIQLTGWDSLRGTGYRVECRRGIKATCSNLSRVVQAKNLSEVTHWSQGLKKLIARRTDVYFDTEKVVMRALKSVEFQSSGIRNIGVMEVTTGHAFLHEKNKALAPLLSATLKEMKAEGLLDKYQSTIDSQ